MYEEIAIIEQDPFAGVVSFRAHRKFAEFFEPVADLIGDRLPLACIRRRADNEIIGERRDLAEV